MSTLAVGQPSLASENGSNDPFASSTSSHTRFSHFDDQLLTLGTDTSPAQAKNVLSAHLAETERRIAEAGRLGNHLVQQRQDLADKLKELEQQQDDGDITPELRQKLVEIEREYIEVGRESARAFLPKSRVSSNELPGSPFVGDTKRSLSPTKFESQANSSPTKLSVPNRKQRNQPSNRVHDIEFATEISTSLIQQVRNLQSMLNEKEDSIKAITAEKSRLEAESEGFHQRLRSLDESEHRYKDENWNLETQIHEFLAAAKEASDREKKLTHNLNVLQLEKTNAQKELDEIKLNHAKLSEDHVSANKHHDLELGTMKRSMISADNERSALQRRIEELTGQNQELAKAVAHQRGRLDDQAHVRTLGEEEFDTAPDNNTPEHSPPPSPTKGTPRHSMLETETLKSSLHHAHRMIQNLKGNIHREKTEKLELKRMLQDARDELDTRRNELGSGNGKKARRTDSKEFKKPFRPLHLGGVRSSRSEVFMEDANWEEDDGERTPVRHTSLAMPGAFSDTHATATESSDQFETANEASDAFETANERGTETEDFQTGAEDLSGSDELTETEGGPDSSIVGSKRPSMYQAGNRHSFQSTASLSGDDYSYGDLRTPTTQPQRLKLKVSRGLNRNSRAVSEDPSFQDSPISVANSSNNGTPQPVRQSLFAELGDLSDEDESLQGTPSRAEFESPAATPSSRPSTAKGKPAALIATPPIPRLPMVDSGIQTDAWEPESAAAPLASLAAGAVVGAGAVEGAHLLSKNSTSPLRASSTDIEPSDEIVNRHLSIGDFTSDRPISMSNYSDSSSQYDAERMDEKLAKFPSPPTSRTHTPMASLGSLQSMSTKPLAISTIASEDIEPSEASAEKTLRPSLSYSAISSEHIEPISVPEPLRDAFIISGIHTEHIEPKAEREPTLPKAAPLTFSRLTSEYVEPREISSLPPPIAPLKISHIASEHVEPVSEKEAPSETRTAPFTFSGIASAHVEPVEIPHTEPTPPSFIISAISTEQVSPIEAPPEKIAPIIAAPSVPIVKEAPPTAPLSLSSLQYVEVVPVASPLPREQRRDAVILPKAHSAETSSENFAISEDKAFPNSQEPIGQLSNDESRQATSRSLGPFREISGNASKQPMAVQTNDGSVQTTLTSAQIDHLFSNKSAISPPYSEEPMSTRSTSPRDVSSFGILRSQQSQESVGSVRHARAKMADPDFGNDTIIIRRPSDAGSVRNGSISSNHPPLPTDHKQVIAAAAQRSGSSNGGLGSMGPPPRPSSATANKQVNPAFRSRTPSQAPLSPALSMKNASTSRSGHMVNRVQSPNGTGRSRQSSVSSFASEIETRFNMRQGLPVPMGIDSGTDPRMINAITQTMIGEYLWKYTRKAGRGAMSENRHRRYFWVHPYTRTLYWSDRDPSTAGRAELKAKSVPIEAVRVVTDDNPMPPGLHRKSLVIVTPGRTVKFTATTGQRHETWFNALSYLLLRTEESVMGDTSEVANGALTAEDVAEFNPGYGNTAGRGRTSLSSYNSRTTRNASPAGQVSRMGSYQPPTLVNNSTSVRPSMTGTLSRLSNYWKPGGGNSTSSRRSRHSVSGNDTFYEASEVHDSAEDLREIIEKQDRESDRLENVRACCDGKHDVGHLHSTSVRGRHASGSVGAASSKAGHTAKPPKNSVNRRTE